MAWLLKLCVGIAIIVMQAIIGARALFPDAFEEPDDSLVRIMAVKKSVLDKIAPEDLGYISDNPDVYVGVDPNFYPLEMFDERGRYTGLGGDYRQLLAKMTGLRFHPVAERDWAATEEKARQGEIDMFMAAAKTGRRSDFMVFTAPYVTLPGVIMTKRGSGAEKLDMEGLKGKRLAVVRDYSWHDFIKEFHPEIVAVPAANTLAALQKVLNGEADAVLDYEFNLLEKIQTAGIMQMQTAGRVDSSYGHAMAVRKDKPELFNVLTVALAQISPQERKLLAQRWLEQGRPDGMEKRLQWIFFFLVEAVLLCLCLNWYVRAATKKALRQCLAHCGQDRRP